LETKTHEPLTCSGDLPGRRMGVNVPHSDTSDEVEDTAEAGLDEAFEAGERLAALLGQKLIGHKKWERAAPARPRTRPGPP
jgi:hypothetical protein